MVILLGSGGYPSWGKRTIGLVLVGIYLFLLLSARGCHRGRATAALIWVCLPKSTPEQKCKPHEHLESGRGGVVVQATLLAVNQVRTHARAHKYTQSQKYTHTVIHTHTHTQSHTQTHTHTHTHCHTVTQTHRHTHTRTYSRTHTHT